MVYRATPHARKNDFTLTAATNHARTSLSNCFLSAPLPLLLAADDVDEAKDLQIVGQFCDIGRGVVQKHGKPVG